MSYGSREHYKYCGENSKSEFNNQGDWTEQGVEEKEKERRKDQAELVEARVEDQQQENGCIVTIFHETIPHNLQQCINSLLIKDLSFG